ncbi:hypothetical protein ACJ73_06144 [Blastomyces percursus]|uniref:Uncharacterized protein n=1 Tax=Blastomyces percursus TaxID=1658174 RepID=A0A1J9R4E8_9EURO|nr:hypothetical protein ACJ73_06144 [Blastomyces percursus]
MATQVGDKALNGEWEEIGARDFHIKEDMTMTFEGRSCNIADCEGKLVEKLGAGDGQATRKVLAGYRCYIMKASVKFEKG